MVHLEEQRGRRVTRKRIVADLREADARLNDHHSDGQVRWADRIAEIEQQVDINGGQPASRSDGPPATAFAAVVLVIAALATTFVQNTMFVIGVPAVLAVALVVGRPTGRQLFTSTRRPIKTVTFSTSQETGAGRSVVQRVARKRIVADLREADARLNDHLKGVEECWTERVAEIERQLDISGVQPAIRSDGLPAAAIVSTSASVTVLLAAAFMGNVAYLIGVPVVLIIAITVMRLSGRELAVIPGRRRYGRTSSAAHGSASSPALLHRH